VIPFIIRIIITHSETAYLHNPACNMSGGGELRLREEEEEEKGGEEEEG